MMALLLRPLLPWLAAVARSAPARRIIDTAPPSAACGAAVPVRAALDSLRARPPAAA